MDLNINFQEIYELLPLAAIVLGEEREIINVNLAAEELLMLGRAKLIGRLWHAVAEADEINTLLTRAQKFHESSYHCGASFKTIASPIQNILKVDVRAKPFAGRFVLLLIDPDERADEWMEEDIRNEINRSAGVMAAMLAHEVNNPLSGIRGAAQLLGEDASPENKPLSELICKEVDRIRGVLDRVELFADQSEFPLEEVNIHEAIRHAKQVAEHGFARNIEFIEKYDPSLPEVTTNRDSVVHILLNLMKNSSEAMVDSDSPKLTLTTFVAHGVFLKKKHGSAIAIEISDNGPGIPSSLKTKLFKPFVTTREAGRGLGLAICSKLAHDLGGKLDLVESPNGTGTRFRLLL